MATSKTPVAYHVGIGIVEADEVRLVVFDIADDGIGHFISAHFRLEVVGRYLWRVDEQAAFSSNSASRPPLKKKVTCGYFSVSAIRTWVIPALEGLRPGYCFTSFW